MKSCSILPASGRDAERALGCEECLKRAQPGFTFVYADLRRGAVATARRAATPPHFHSTGHPIIEGYDPPEGWGWCYVDQVAVDLSG